MATNKYYSLLGEILARGKVQPGKKGDIRYLLNERLELTPGDLLDIFEGHGIARRKLRDELDLFMQGERNVERYREAGITWWVQPTARLPSACGAPPNGGTACDLPSKFSRNFRRWLRGSIASGATARIMCCSWVRPTPRATRRRAFRWCSLSAAPALSFAPRHRELGSCGLGLSKVQIDEGSLVLLAYQRSSDANLGLPADIYHLYLMARQIDLPLKSITLNLGNVHIYETNLDRTRRLLDGEENMKFELNV